MGLPDARRVLLCLRYGIGDVIMELPVVETLRRMLPNARITGLGASPALELLENDPRIDMLPGIHIWGLHHWGDSGDSTVKTCIKHWIRQEEFDLILDPSHAVFAVRDAIWELDHPAVRDTPSPTTILMNGRGGVTAIKEAAAHGWGIEIRENLAPRLHLPPDAIDFAERFLVRHGMAGCRIAGISPVASSHLKQWPAERLAETSDHLTDNRDYRILQFCGPQESACRDVVRHMHRPERVLSVGSFHLSQVAALLSKCSFFIGNDTGLMHMASALDVPVIAIFGPTSPHLYLPENGAMAVTGIDIACPHRKIDSFGPSPCIIESRCLTADQGCITRAETGQVIAAIEQLAARLFFPLNS